MLIHTAAHTEQPNLLFVGLTCNLGETNPKFTLFNRHHIPVIDLTQIDTVYCITSLQTAVVKAEIKY